jgi:signal transduction histidine kinase/iron only hydrogenase large subunit-like protein
MNRGDYDIPLITTEKDRCRVCYTCVRECPAKAIRIVGGQAEVIPERCIGCGNCVKVCSQGAKTVLDTTKEALDVLHASERVAAIVAPSFPAQFPGDYKKLVGRLRALGFDLVCEVAFGADLVARAYRELLKSDETGRYIATSCPAVVGYVERYHPDLIPSLAPIVSPMVATARALRHKYGKDLKVVFIGPCIAKKAEGVEDPGVNELDAAVTFMELETLFQTEGIPTDLEVSDFDPPYAGLGALFPISRGMLQAAGIEEDLMVGEVVTADGRTDFVEAIKEFETGDLEARLLETLSCNGCIMGPGISSQAPLFRRRAWVSQFVRGRMKELDEDTLRAQYEEFKGLDLSRDYRGKDQRIPIPSKEELEKILARMGKLDPKDELDCGACGYDTCREHAVAIFKGLAESEMCLPYTIDQLNTTVDELAISNNELANTREALIQSEKLASMGQLAAGIAHEVNNPLGVVLMYAHLLLEEVEGKEEKGQLNEDLKMIAEQADRCKKIVAGLLDFARQNKVQLQRTNLTEIVKSAVKVTPPPAHISLHTEHPKGDIQVDLDGDQILQVITNLLTNAYAAMTDGGDLWVRTDVDDVHARVEVEDTGCGIPADIKAKVFEPFFTTKQIGKGTGLGLAVTYGIVKMHRGDIQIESNTDPQAGPTGTKCIVKLPVEAQNT